MCSTESKSFIPIKLYSHGSILRSINKVDKIVKYLKDNNYRGGILTDLDNIFLAVPFYKAMKKSGLKAGIGCGLTVNKSLAITFICKNKRGWQNLIKLISVASRNNRDSPFLKINQIAEYSSDLYCLVGSPYSFHSVEEHEYIGVALDLEEIFQDNLVVEFHPSYSYIKDILTSVLKNRMIVAASDCFYLDKEDKQLNDILISSLLKKKLTDPEVREHFLVKETLDFKDLSYLNNEYVENTNQLLDSLEDLDILREPALPDFGVDDPSKTLREMCEKELRALNLGDEHRKRLEHELRVISEAGFDSYFLIVQDVIKYAKSKNMLIGGCRGCVSPDTRIATLNTYKRIIDINIGDYVIAKDGLPHRVNQVFMYRNDEPMYRIHSYYGSSNGICLTKDHKVFTKRGWIEAQELTSTDYVFMPKLLKNNYATSIADQDTCYIFGLLTGDGYNRAGRKTEVNIIFHNNELMALTRACHIISMYGFRYSIYNRPSNNTITLNILSKEFHEIFERAFYDYKQSPDTKHVPSGMRLFAHNLNYQICPNNISAYLDGYCQADGHKYSKTTRKFTTISDRLAHEVKFLHGILNRVCSISKNSNRNEYDLKTTTKPKFAEICNEGIWAKIRKIEIEDPKGLYVYDLEVDGEHNYLTTDGLIHNSVGGSITSFLSGITDIDPLEYGLLFERFYNSSRNFEKHVNFDERSYVEFKNENI